MSFKDEDILAFDTATGAWSMHFDGSDVGVTADLNAFYVQSNGSVLMSFQQSTSIGSLGAVDDSDIVRFIPTSVGANTVGTFELYFDGSDVGLTRSGEDIDALYLLSDGRLVISTVGNHSVPGASGRGEDLTIFTPSALGSSTSGTWAVYFDGSDVGLSNSSPEDVNGTWVDEATGDIYLSTVGSFGVTGSSGDGADIFVCHPSSTGPSTSCSFGPGLYWDGSEHGFAGEILDAFFIDR